MLIPVHEGDINRLIAALGIDGSPVRLDLEPKPHSLPCECFPNVEKQVQKQGGEIVYGWQLWQSGSFFIEAEFHAIWRDPDGILHDITPKPLPTITQILFVEDVNRTYQGQQVNNVRLNLSGNKVVDHFLKLSDKKFEIENAGDRADQHQISLQGDELEMYEGLMRLLMDMEQFMKSGATVRSPCLCGSGEKYKKCHGRMIEAFV